MNFSFDWLIFSELHLWKASLNTLNAKLNPICHLLALLEAHRILHVSRLRVNTVDFSWLFQQFSDGDGLSLGAFAKLWKSTISFVVSLSAWNSSAPARRIFIKFNIWLFFENLSRIFKYCYKLTRIRETLHEATKTCLAEFLLEREIFRQKL
jgi:hypothetical protein